MQRKILFRGKRKVNQQWVEGDLTRTIDGECVIQVSEGNWFEKHIVDAETVGQLHNALTKKAGTKIFEGDIIAFEFYAGPGQPGTFNSNYKEPVHIEVSYQYYKDVRLLGNIHDNPNLF